MNRLKPEMSRIVDQSHEFPARNSGIVRFVPPYGRRHKHAIRIDRSADLYAHSRKTVLGSRHDQIPRPIPIRQKRQELREK